MRCQIPERSDQSVTIGWRFLSDLEAGTHSLDVDSDILWSRHSALVYKLVALLLKLN